jgi:hypothetical protein
MRMQEFRSFGVEISFDFYLFTYFDHAWSKLCVTDLQIRWAY